MNAALGTTLLATLATVLASCGGPQSSVIPRLPGDGDVHTVKPRENAESAAPDRWSGKELIPAPAPLTPEVLSLPPIERFVLANGLTVVAVTSADAPTFQARLAIKAGRRHEGREVVGVSSFVASMLPRGAQGRNETLIARSLEQVGAQLRSDASFEATVVRCHAPAAGANACLDNTARMVSTPTFPAAAMAEVRSQLTTGARRSLQDPGQLANLHFQNALWGDDHARGRPMTERSIAAIDRKQLVDFHRRFYQPKNSVLVVVSSESGTALRNRIGRAFNRWRSTVPASPDVMPVPDVSGLSIRLIDLFSQEQAHIRVGSLGFAHGDANFASATLVNQVLGGRAPVSRIGLALAQDHPRVNAQSSFDRNQERGAFVAAAVAPSDKAVTTMRLLIDQIGQMATTGPTQEELVAARTEIAGNYQVQLESSEDLASALLAAELHGLPPTYVEQFAASLGEVSESSAKKLAGSWLDPQNLIIVIAGDADSIAPQLKEAGLKFERFAAQDPITGYDRAADKELPVVDPAKDKAARAILEGALAAKGGHAAVSGLKTLSWKGKAELALPGGRVPATVEKRFVSPNKLRLDMTVQGAGATMTITTVLNNNKGWAQEARPDGKRAIDFPASEIEAGKAQIWRDQDFVLLRHREPGAIVRPLDEIVIDGAPHHAISIMSADGKRSAVLYVHKKTKRLGGMSYSEGQLSAEERFGNYKQINGIWFAHTRTTKSAQIDLTTQVTDVQVNPKIETSIFTKPK